MRTPAAILIAASLATLPILPVHAVLPRPTAPAPAPATDERAAEILRRAAEHLAGMNAYTFTFRAGRTTSAEGLFSEYYSEYAAAIDRRTGRRALIFQSGMPSVSRVSNGEQMTTYLPTPSIYTLDEPAQDSDDFLDVGPLTFAEYLVAAMQTPGLRTAVSDDPVALTEPLLEHAAYAGIEEVNGRRAHRVTVTLDDQTIDIWVAADGDPVLLQTQVPLPSDDDDGFWKDYKIVGWTRFADWKREDAIPADRFAFTPPADAARVDDLDRGFMAAMGMDWDDDDWEEEEDPAVDLVGNPAPTFTLELLDGGTFDLAELIKQEKVIVLDFWATWCPPCRAGLPILAEVTSAYDPEKVAFYAINLREAGPTIEKFLQTTKLDLKVPLDTDGKVAEMYGVTGIPQTVLIGKDGSVQALHVGLLPNLRDRLKEEIDALVEGKPLAGTDHE